jgi:hypothetical protein
VGRGTSARFGTVARPRRPGTLAHAVDPGWPGSGVHVAAGAPLISNEARVRARADQTLRAVRGPGAILSARK